MIFMKRILIISCLAIYAGLCVSAHAQFSVNWFSIDGGAGQSAGGAFSLNGTIGQPDAGTIGGSPYSILGGFWAFAADTSTASPLLSIERLGGNVRLFWSFPANGFVLEQADALANSSWTQPAFAYQTNATQVYVIVPASGSNRYFRLYAP